MPKGPCGEKRPDAIGLAVMWAGSRPVRLRTTERPQGGGGEAMEGPLGGD
jgi:hypothetical protein